jgi:misacylated tRNA(Ala) deacylase
MNIPAQNFLFREDAYLRNCTANVLAVTERGIMLDQTIFYATSGGQPGDTGWFARADGSNIRIAATVTGESKEDIIQIPTPDQPVPGVGEALTLRLDWERRFKLMRMHTACHILSVVCPFPITGASVGEEESRVDFDLPDAGMTRESVTASMMALISAACPVSTRWITEAELDANPGLVKSKNVRPPRGQGRIRLVLIGENGSIDSQPCGGTHVANVAEIGPVHISKIEKKGRENRRFRIRFGTLTESGA